MLLDRVRFKMKKFLRKFLQKLCLSKQLGNPKRGRAVNNETVQVNTLLDTASNYFLIFLLTTKLPNLGSKRLSQILTY